MSLSTRLDKLEAAMRGRDPPDEPWLVYRLHEWAEGCPVALEEWKLENIPQFRANALDRLVAARKIREIDRERVTFIVRTIVHRPERADG
jgi:hypothetical protein